MKTPLIIGNWKMNKTVSEGIRLLTELKAALSGKLDADVAVAPSFVSLYPAEVALHGTPIRLAAQTMHFEESGAYTGEVSAEMLVNVGCRFVILGHSERRAHFLETNAVINKKVKAALAAELTPVLCVGETKDERAAGKAFDTVDLQIQECLRGVGDADAVSVVLAYEPIWAIGTGDTATPETAQEMHSFIRGKLGNIFPRDLASGIRIIYGGSVTPDNAGDLLAQGDIDGLLVGGASLNVRSFESIVKFAD